MTMHVGVVAVATPLLALGVAGSRFDPVRRAPAWFPAIPLSVLELVVVWVWHVPALHHLARTSRAFFAFEQACFLAAGLLIWIAAFGGDQRERAERRAAGVVALLLTSMHMTLLGALLALPPRALYAHAPTVERGALSPLDDQHLGGAVMLIVGAIAYLAGGLWLVFDLLREQRDPARGSRAPWRRASLARTMQARREP
jgi:putative membrane protein